jgi:oligopeptide transport system ATP-binding protein
MDSNSLSINTPPALNEPVLRVRNLDISYHTEEGDVLAVQQANFSLHRGEVLGLVGESGCGKSTLGLGLLRLLRWPGQISGGEAFFHNTDLFKLSESQMRALRGDRLAMIFQNPMSSLNPTETVGAQIAETITTHRRMNRSALQQRCVELLELVGIPGAGQRIKNYPHEFSGGMRQRVLIALALALDPELLVADEPTTALDLTIQGQILWLLENIQQRAMMTMIYITHNLAVASSISHRIAVMYAGWIIESAPAEDVFLRPVHPYTIGLIASIPKTYWRDQRVTAIYGQPPRLKVGALGCPFAPRCSRFSEICKEAMPPETEIGPNHFVRCFHV